MKKLTILLLAIYSFMYCTYPIQAHTVINKNSLDTKTPILKIPYSNGYITISNFKDDGDQRLWGVLNNYQYMVYKNIGKFIYVNGEFHQIQGKWVNGKFYIPEEDAMSFFNLKGQNGTYQTIQNSESVGCQDITKEEVLKRLSAPHIPIGGAAITIIPAQMPGADRSYRNGKHEGFDWYAGAIGVTITKQTKVHPIFEGTIIRIDKQFVELTPEVRQTMLDQDMKDKNTPQSDLDKLRGRQVWIQSKDGILVHYAHLSSVNKNLKVGDEVKLTDWIGTVGNSGTSNGTLGNNEDLHLHSDILVCGKNFWEYGKTSEMNNDLIKIFDEANQKQKKQSEVK